MYAALFLCVVFTFAFMLVTRLVENKMMPHLLFYGPPGTGKTSTILAIARQMYGKNLQTMVLTVLVVGYCRCRD